MYDFPKATSAFQQSPTKDLSTPFEKNLVLISSVETAANYTKYMQIMM